MKTKIMVGVLASAFTLSPAYATVFTSAGASYGDRDSDTAATGMVRSESAWALTYVGASSKAIAGHGILKAYTGGAADGNNGIISDASAGWSDWVTIDGGALNGRRATATFSLKYDYFLFGEIGPESNKLARSSVSVDFGVYSGVTYSGRASQDMWVSYGNYYGEPGVTVTDYFGTSYPTPSGLLNITAEFTLGNPFLMHATLGVSGGAGWGSTGFAQYATDASHSSYWGGIKNVVTEGQSLTNYSISSVSGTDYSQSMIPNEIPEPNSVALLTIGILSFGALKRHRST